MQGLSDVAKLTLMRTTKEQGREEKGIYLVHELHKAMRSFPREIVNPQCDHHESQRRQLPTFAVSLRRFGEFGGKNVLEFLDNRHEG